MLDNQRKRNIIQLFGSNKKLAILSLLLKHIPVLLEGLKIASLEMRNFEIIKDVKLIIIVHFDFQRLLEIQQNNSKY